MNSMTITQQTLVELIRTSCKKFKTSPEACITLTQTDDVITHQHFASPSEAPVIPCRVFVEAGEAPAMTAMSFRSSVPMEFPELVMVDHINKIK